MSGQVNDPHAAPAQFPGDLIAVDHRKDRLPIDVAARVAVGNHVERCLVLTLEHHATVEPGLDNCFGAVRHIEPLGEQARPEMLPEEFHAVLELLNPAVVDHVAHKLGVAGGVDGECHRQPFQSPVEVLAA